jgi:hypothetical protein
VSKIVPGVNRPGAEMPAPAGEMLPGARAALRSEEECRSDADRGPEEGAGREDRDVLPIEIPIVGRG